jgi:hypothetical protein
MKNLVLFFTLMLGMFILSCSKEKDSIDSKQNANVVDPAADKSAEMQSGIKLKSIPALQSINVPHVFMKYYGLAGVACANMVCNYYNSYPVLETIATECGTVYGQHLGEGGTNIYNVASYLNNHAIGKAYLPSNWKWYVVNLTTSADFSSKVQSSVGGYSAPQIWYLATYPSSVAHLPGYDSNNFLHVVTGCGYNNYNASVCYDDPFYGGTNNKGWVATSTMFACIYANAHVIIW